MASIQEAIASLGQRIDGQQTQQVPVQEGTQFDTTVPPPPPHSQLAPQTIPFTLHSQTEVSPPPAIVPTPISEDPHALASLPAKFRMPEIERYTGIGCPRIHLRLYSTVMRAHGLDDAQMVMLFPMLLSGAAQRWFASLEVSRRRTWDDLAQEFLRQFAFNTVIDVSRRELEALRQRPEESVTSFISRWREKISQIIDQEGIARGLWSESSSIDPKGKRPLGGQRSGVVGAISSVGMRPPRRYQTVGQIPGFYYPPSPHTHYRPLAPSRPMTPTYLHPRPPRQFAQLGMPLSRAFQKLAEGHDTDHCTALRHAIQDLIDQGLVNLGQPSVTTNPLPAHSTHAVHPSSGDIHHMDLIEDDSIHMLSWDDGLPEPIVLYDSYEVNGVSVVPQTPAPFKDDDSEGREIQIVTRSGRIAQPPPPAVRHLRVQPLMRRPRAPLYITVGCSGRRVPSVLLDNDSALNVCPLATAIALGFAPSDFGPSTQTVRAYDSTKREVMGTLVIDLQIGLATFSTLFQVLRIPTSFNLLLGRPWIYVAGAIPSSLHQKVKFIHDGQVITVRSTRDIFVASEPVLQISHRRRQQGPSEFIAAIDHDTTFGLGFIPTEVDYRHMEWLRKERVRARLSYTPFDYPIRLYRMSLADYFVRGSETRPRLEEIDSVAHTDRETIFSIYFTSYKEITSDGVIVDPIEVIDGVVPHDEYRDEMDMMTVSQITGIVQLQPISPFDMFGVSTIEVLEGTQIIPVPELLEDDSSSFEGIVSLVEERPTLWTHLFLLMDVETVDFGTEDQPRELKIGHASLDPSIVQHHLPTLPHARPVKQKLRRLHPRWSLQDGKVRVCVDFRDLNKASPKDDFPLPHIDLLVDGTASHSMLSFMDGFSGYNQILMAPEDMEKTTFITEWGYLLLQSYAIWVENAGATYQRAATTLFHDMMHRDVEVYVDDMIVKSRGRVDHLDALERFFERIRKFGLS
ncbi:Transposon Ty3-G Gag-Pol polyprotein [Vitis vinifera]|uniref:Transposon Ty3-G Gag-Pol polyprotein n=1 Tax=Vitis vinifera TaxID=29760 RepID=A0A438DV88_VITVI|nr:Transposon Ty3-G Gag-Pol polyprotein [Vitis vinifera]